jgi:ferrochelatase
MTTGCLLISHGTVDDLADLPAFLRNIRRGHEAPPELLEEVTRRYRAIGGASPLNRISVELAAKVEAALGVPTRYAGRLWKPDAGEVASALAGAGVDRLVVVPLAQYSAKIYVEHVQNACKGLPLSIVGAGNWGLTPGILDAFAGAIAAGRAAAGDPHVLMTAHSLPKAIVDQGDPYEHEVRAAAAALAEKLGLAKWSVAFQSQGMGTGPGGRPMVWLGPDLRSALEGLKGAGETSVLLAPIGFLADHVEILYDLDIEAQGWAKELGLSLSRTASLNASSDLVNAIASVARPLLAR